MKVLAFSGRNVKEILRDPLSLLFCLAFPVLLLLLFQLIVSAIGEDALSRFPARSACSPTLFPCSFSPCSSQKTVRRLF